MKKIRILFALLMLFFSTNAFAGTITINASDHTDLAMISGGMNIGYSVEQRQAAISQLIGAYRQEHGFFSVPIGTVVRVVWEDGSVEKAIVKALSGSEAAEIIPGTQSKPRNGGVGYTVDQYGNSLGGLNVVGFTPLYTSTTVCISGYCESDTVITGYQFIYGPGGRPGSEAV